ncbi:MAG: hypothetical protein HY816_20790 [Candidatus Wallbacteria bacterium]|nr:hypothetical protein [Candidatus Wallbacteria bacterium]
MELGHGAMLFLDTSFLVALMVRDDAHHAAALILRDRSRVENWRLLTHAGGSGFSPLRPSTSPGRTAGQRVERELMVLSGCREEVELGGHRGTGFATMVTMHHVRLAIVWLGLLCLTVRLAGADGEKTTWKHALAAYEAGEFAVCSNILQEFRKGDRFPSLGDAAKARVHMVLGLALARQGKLEASDEAFAISERLAGLKEDPLLNSKERSARIVDAIRSVKNQATLDAGEAPRREAPVSQREAGLSGEALDASAGAGTSPPAMPSPPPPSPGVTRWIVIVLETTGLLVAGCFIVPGARLKNLLSALGAAVLLNVVNVLVAGAAALLGIGLFAAGWSPWAGLAAGGSFLIHLGALLLFLLVMSAACLRLVSGFVSGFELDGWLPASLLALFVILGHAILSFVGG